MPILDGHPDASSLCTALARSHGDGIRSGNATARVLALRDLRFDPILHLGYHGQQPLEPDLHEAQEAIAAARRPVVVTPIWWGSMPALLKGFFDRVLERGWAFRYLPNGMPEGLLAGRSARVIMTTDSPGYYLRFVQGDPTAKALVRRTLTFCGIEHVDVTRVGPVHQSDARQRQAWLNQVRAQGRADTARLPAMAPPRVPAHPG